jgi:ABC-type dipeptide/oligopeptide/nickel transport system permease component
MLWTAAICTGLWLLFPKAFKYWVGTLIGTFGALFFWGVFVVAWGVGHNFDISSGLFVWSLVASVVIGNMLGILIAAKG